MTWLHVAATVLTLVLSIVALREARRAGRRVDDLPAPLPPEPPPPAPAPLDDEGLRRALGTEQEARQTLARRIAVLERARQDQEVQAAHLAERLNAQAARVEAQADEAPPPEPVLDEHASAETPPSPAERARQALEEAGYRRVVLLPRADDPLSFLVEAERGGAINKGRATVHDGDPSVTLSIQPALRAFP